FGSNLLRHLLRCFFRRGFLGGLLDGLLCSFLRRRFFGCLLDGFLHGLLGGFFRSLLGGLLLCHQNLLILGSENSLLGSTHLIPKTSCVEGVPALLGVLLTRQRTAAGKEVLTDAVRAAHENVFRACSFGRESRRVQLAERGLAGGALHVQLPVTHCNLHARFAISIHPGMTAQIVRRDVECAPADRRFRLHRW